MLRAPDARILDVAVACGFKTQQHFAQVFRDVCRVSPTEYRQDFLDSEVRHDSETGSEDTAVLPAISDSQLTCRIDREFLVHSSFHPPQHYRLKQQF